MKYSKKITWKKISSKIAHKNPWYVIREDDVIRPDGKKGKYFVVDEINSVAIIAEDSDGKIYLVGQTRYPINSLYSWEIITGGYKRETPLEAAKRELEEEAGVVAKDWKSLGYFYPVNGYASEKTSVFLARKLAKTKTNFEGSEDIKVKKESLEKILKKIENDEISDGLTVGGILKYLIYKKMIKKEHEINHFGIGNGFNK